MKHNMSEVPKQALPAACYQSCLRAGRERARLRGKGRVCFPRLEDVSLQLEPDSLVKPDTKILSAGREGGRDASTWEYRYDLKADGHHKHIWAPWRAPAASLPCPSSNTRSEKACFDPQLRHFRAPTKMKYDDGCLSRSPLPHHSIPLKGRRSTTTLCQRCQQTTGLGLMTTPGGKNSPQLIYSLRCFKEGRENTLQQREAAQKHG